MATNSSSRKLTWGGGYGIVEVVDEILSLDPRAAGVVMNWQFFGSNGQETADYSKGVLERFTRRAPKEWSERIPSGIIGGNVIVKTLSNPRRINFFGHPHFPVYFTGHYSINENGKVVPRYSNDPVTADKIALHHYYAKSLEEFAVKRGRGFADQYGKTSRNDEWFDVYDRNDEFDDSILRYRAARMKTYQPPDNARSAERMLAALEKNLSPTLSTNTPQEFYRDKMETLLTCRAVASYLQSKLACYASAKFFEETALKAIPRAFNEMSVADALLLLREMPELLKLSYPAAKELRKEFVRYTPKFLENLRLNKLYRDYVELNYVKDLIYLKE